MSPELLATAAALLSALIHAGWNTLVKHDKGDRLASMVAINLSAIPIALPFMVALPLPGPDILPWLALSILIHTGYQLFLIRAYRYGDLSHVYPIARGTAPLLVAVGALGLVGETLEPAQWLGVALLSAGILSLSLPALARGSAGRRAVPFALATGAFIASYTVIDGFAARSGHGLAYFFWLTFGSAVAIGAVGLARRGRALVPAVRARPRAFLGGIVALGGYGLVVWAMAIIPIAVVSALRETSVLLAAAFGALILKERFGWPRIAAALLVVGGATMLRMA